MVFTIIIYICTSQVTNAKEKVVRTSRVKYENRDGTVTEATARNEKISAHDLLMEGVQIGKSKFDDVKNIFGSGEIVHFGDASNSTNYLCYRGTDGTTVFFSSGELMGGQVIDAISVFRSDDQFYRYVYCSTSKTITQNISTQSGINLKQHRNSLTKNRGKPSRSNKSMIEYLYKFSEPWKNEVLDHFSSIEFNFSGRELQSFHITWSEST